MKWRRSPPRDAVRATQVDDRLEEWIAAQKELTEQMKRKADELVVHAGRIRKVLDDE